MGCLECKDDDVTPCCHYTGLCEAAKTEDDISLCIHCCEEMLRVNQLWYHWSQFENGVLISSAKPQGEE